VEEDTKELDILENIGVKRGCLKKGSVIDIDKAADIIIDEFRAGKLGRISLERP
jgi:ribosome biogenesis GTPase A